MEQRFGFIHDEMDIKVLTLFVLSRLPEPVPQSTLTDMILLCDDGIGYFEFSDCLADLKRTEHVDENEAGFFITEKGRENGSVTESGLPYSVRIRAERAASTLAKIQKRNASIHASHEMRHRGGYTVKLSMSDGIGPILDMELLTGSDTLSAIIEKNFRENAETIYNKIINILLEE